ncbi:hypothetical protein [Psychromarinibacter sp. S121]|uniref:hypothetical protein n=1 Tax=Psychromarinibacter sp. S121 TaxID=3415127 RepID=UPI003C7CDEE7
MTMLSREFVAAEAVNQPLADLLEELRTAQTPVVAGMPHPPRQRRDYLMALAAAYEAGDLVLATDPRA